MMARPNAPTGNSYALEQMERLCAGFKGAVLFDEAYADFADDNCDSFLKKYPNVIVSRTFSKSRSLAGIRFGYALAQPEIIMEMMKVKDSYNVNALTQLFALTSFRDRAYLAETSSKVRAGRIPGKTGGDRFSGDSVADELPVRRAAGSRRKRFFRIPAHETGARPLFPRRNDRRICPHHHRTPGRYGVSSGMRKGVLREKLTAEFRESTHRRRSATVRFCFQRSGRTAFATVR